MIILDFKVYNYCWYFDDEEMFYNIRNIASIYFSPRFNIENILSKKVYELSHSEEILLNNATLRFFINNVIDY